MKQYRKPLTALLFLTAACAGLPFLSALEMSEVVLVAPAMSMASPTPEKPEGPRSPEPASKRETPPDPLPEISLQTTPYFDWGVLKHAKAAFDAAQFRTARRLLADQGDRLEVRFLRAMAAFRGGDFKTAAPELHALAEDYEAVRDRCWMYAAVSWEKLARAQDALDAYGRVPAGSVFFHTARLAAAKVAQAQGEFERVREVLSPLLEEGSPHRAHALQAWMSMEAQRSNTPAVQALALELWAKHPETAGSTEAAARVNPQALTADAKLLRAESFLEAGQVGASLALAQAVNSPGLKGTATGCRAQLLIARGYSRLKQKIAARQLLDQLLLACPDFTSRGQALALIADGQEGMEAIATYDRLVAEHPTHPLASEALFNAGVWASRGGDSRGALDRFEAVLARYPDSDKAPDAAFRTFWLHRQAGAFSAALSALDRLNTLQSEQQREAHPQAEYWKARMWEEGGNRAVAAELFEHLAESAPGTYYGLLAQSRLLNIDPARSALSALVLDAQVQSSPGAGALEGLFKNLHFAAGVELHRLGMPGAVAELLSVDLSNQPSEAKAFVLQALWEAGRRKEVFALATQGDSPGAFTQETRPVWRMAFPNTFRMLVERSAASSQVDPNLLQAVVREESGFDPTVKSGAGALGLAQLMPSTAALIAQKAGLAHAGETSLLDPHHNLTLGSLYLRTLIRMFRGNVVYAVASYNAGPGAVLKWMSSKPHLETDEWVEEIPFKETRLYVKRVLSSYAAYSLLSNQDLAPRMATLVPRVAAEVAN